MSVNGANPSGVRGSRRERERFNNESRASEASLRRRNGETHSHWPSLIRLPSVLKILSRLYGPALSRLGSPGQKSADCVRDLVFAPRRLESSVPFSLNLARPLTRAGPSSLSTTSRPTPHTARPTPELAGFLPTRTRALLLRATPSAHRLVGVRAHHTHHKAPTCLQEQQPPSSPKPSPRPPAAAPRTAQPAARDGRRARRHAERVSGGRARPTRMRTLACRMATRVRRRGGGGGRAGAGPWARG